MTETGINSRSFQRVLSRNIALPLAMCVALSVIFIGMLFNLLSVNQQVTQSDILISKANESLRHVIDSETGLRGFLLTNQEPFLEPYKSGTRKVPAEFAELKNLATEFPGQVGHVAKAEEIFKRWQESADSAIKSRRANPGSATEIVQRKTYMDAVRDEFAAFLSAAESARDQRVQKTEENTRLNLGLIIIFSLVTGAIMAVLGRKQLLSLSRTYEKAMQLQQEQNETLQQQAWLRTTQAELGEKIRGDLTEADLAVRIMEHLASALGASIGTFYIMRGFKELQFMAGHALSDPASFRNRVIELGEGLVGQVAAQRRPQLVEDLPADYLKVSSTLGHTRPRHLVISPLTADGVIQGVIELGFMDSIPKRTLNFLDLSAEMLGTGIRSAAYRSRLQDLLFKSQQLTEELQTQQEELRVSNEELSERSHALQDTQARLESQHAELEQTNEQLEEQAQILEHQKQNLDERNQDLESAREAIEDKARELEAASRYKSEFLANMSHELRTPLNSTLILAKLLKDNSSNNLTAEQVEFASTIYGAGNDLLVLINDILDLSKVEAGKLEIVAEKFDLDKLLMGLERAFSAVAAEKKLKLKFIVDSTASRELLTDRLRLEQILKNLISNALKFTAEGGVTVRVFAGVPNADRAQLSFRVEDTGVGIEPTQHEVIFEAFRQADGTTNRKYGGTGLGLSISRNLALLLGGGIYVESEAGKGSAFTLTLPTHLEIVSPNATSSDTPEAGHASLFSGRAPRGLDAPSAVPLPASSTKPGLPPFEDDREHLGEKGKRTLLVVEDEPKFAKILFELAHEQGFKCLVASNTSDGRALAFQFLPHAIILDMKLPDGSGLTLLDLLKANPKTRHIPVHAISGADYSREALHLGAVGYLQKPASRDDLKKSLQKLEEIITRGIKRVLIVEDDAVQRSSVEKLIGEKGVDIVSVGTGGESLALLRSSTFDCMIMDLSLPDMSGFDLLEAMAQDSDSDFPPVIVYTGRSLSRAEEERLNRYSRTIIIKGARSPERLLDEVTLFLHQVESGLTPERQKILRESRSRDRSFENRKILIADDDVRNIFALTSLLEHQGASIRIARNGKEALTRLEQEPDMDLVLMDIMMPEMDGYEAIATLRKEPQFAKLPIIAVTAKAMRDDYEKCLAAGANDYLAKPVDVDKLLSLIRVWLPNNIGGY